MKSKVSDFKENLPLIQCICNKGMRDRHWEQMSTIVEFSIKPDQVEFTMLIKATTTTTTMYI